MWRSCCLVLGVFAAWAFIGHADEAAAPEKARAFALEDQYEKIHKIAFPRKKPVVFSIADTGGAEDAPVWTEKINKKFGERIEFLRMANLSFIPTVARGGARVGIKATTKDLVLCDWDGKVSAGLKAKKGMANIIVVSRTGEILHRVTGKPTEAKLNKVYAVIEAASQEPEGEGPNAS